MFGKWELDRTLQLHRIRGNLQRCSSCLRKYEILYYAILKIICPVTQCGFTSTFNILCYLLIMLLGGHWIFSFHLTDSKPVRLVNGTHPCSGRVEVHHDGQWGTICDDGWGMQEAEVTCREMRCGAALSVKYMAFYGKGQGQLWLDDVDCSGHENALADCPHRGYGVHDCNHNEDAGVECSGKNTLLCDAKHFCVVLTLI